MPFLGWVSFLEGEGLSTVGYIYSIMASLTRLDENSRSILIRVRGELNDAGIPNATFSDAIRALDDYRLDMRS